MFHKIFKCLVNLLHNLKAKLHKSGLVSFIFIVTITRNANVLTASVLNCFDIKVHEK